MQDKTPTSLHECRITDTHALAVAVKSSSGKDTVSLTQKGNFITYIDNVSTEIEGVLLATGTKVLTSQVLGFPQNIPDKHIYSELNYHAAGEAVIVTADHGRDIRRLIGVYQGNICTIIVNVKGKEAQNKAFSKLFTLKGFRDYEQLPRRYSEIRLSRQGRDLIIKATDIRAGRDKPRDKKIRNFWL